MNKVIVMSGVSGSGKSTVARNLIEQEIGGVIVSADDFFMKDGGYRFDASELSAAHASCFHKFIQSMQTSLPLIVVDNTNTTAIEISPYVLAASAFGYDCEIVTVQLGAIDSGELEKLMLKAALRNHHGVNVGTIAQQHKRIRMRDLPPWWKARDIVAQF